MEYTLQEAISYGQEGKVETWVHKFLCSEIGHNPQFSQGLKQQKRYWVGPIQVKLTLLQACCGPGEDMEYQVDRDNWERDMEVFQQRISQGWEPPPLIAENNDDYLSIRDGNHRLEALRRLGYEKYWVIIWDNLSQERLNKWLEEGSHDL